MKDLILLMKSHKKTEFHPLFRYVFRKTIGGGGQIDRPNYFRGKAKNGLSPPSMSKIFVENAKHHYDLRKNAEFKRNMLKPCTAELKL